MFKIFKNIFKRIKHFFESFLPSFKSNKFLFFIIGIISIKILYNYLPQQSTPSEILNLLRNDNSIQEVNLMSDSVLLHRNNQYYYSNTNNVLNNLITYEVISKNLKFTVSDNIIISFLCNPINRFSIACGLTGYFGLDFLQSYKRKKNIGFKQRTDVFESYIGKPDIIKTFNLIIDQLRNPDKYVQKKIKLIKGVLLYGKPGTGKTLIARCLSQLDDITFINTSAAEYVELYVGSGPKNVRKFFENARKSRPAIIFIDELEAIGIKRPSDSNSYERNIERYSTLNQLLVEMDGVKDLNNIVVIGSTNREDFLDPALIRPGRFDYKIYIPLPNKDERIEIFKLYMNKFKHCINDEEFEFIGVESEGFTGAIIEDVVNKAYTRVIMRTEEVIEFIDITDFINRAKNEIRIFYD